MADSDAKKLDRKVDQFADQLVLILAGFVGFLPILGFWMVPLGLLLIAQDVPFLQRPILRLIEWGERKWKELKRWWKS